MTRVVSMIAKSPTLIVEESTPGPSCRIVPLLLGVVEVELNTRAPIVVSPGVRYRSTIERNKVIELLSEFI